MTMRSTIAVLAACNACFVWYSAWRWFAGRDGSRHVGNAWLLICFGGFLAQNGLGRIAAIQRGDAVSWQDPVWLTLQVLTTIGCAYVWQSIPSVRNIDVNKEELFRELKKIHALVNSNMTTEMKHTLTALEGQYLAILELLDLRREQGQTPNHGAEATLASIKNHIQELRETLKIREWEAVREAKEDV